MYITINYLICSGKKYRMTLDKSKWVKDLWYWVMRIIFLSIIKIFWSWLMPLISRISVISFPWPGWPYDFCTSSRRSSLNSFTVLLYFSILFHFYWPLLSRNSCFCCPLTRSSSISTSFLARPLLWIKNLLY